MICISTAGTADPAPFRRAAELGLAPDGGLYMPAHIPALDKTLLDGEKEPTLQEIAVAVTSFFTADTPAHASLDEWVREAIHFEAPLVRLRDDLYILELFHGPTLAFKDFGARFMSRYFRASGLLEGEPLTILAATSGDTGSAVANGFYRMNGVEVCLLFPKGKVSDVQRKQMTTLGHNVTALEVDGTFDDCQKLVKQAFNDTSLRAKKRLSSANSINLARLVPQTFYYLHAAVQLHRQTGHSPVFSVPSGNFGNLTAGLLAERMGMAVERFIAATNCNSVVPEFLNGSGFEPRPSVQTISNAMDVGNPSNFDRMMHLFRGDADAMRKHLFGASFSDDETRLAIRRTYRENGYIADPHTAVGLLAVEAAREKKITDAPAIVLATAHPAKFRETVEASMEASVPIPERLKAALRKPEKSLPMAADYPALRDYLLDS
ncbi:MAG: threonine synthase [Balneolaceae bacterium]